MNGTFRKGMMDGNTGRDRMDNERGEVDSGEMSYEAFGVQFFDQIVTARRIESVLQRLTGEPIDFGPTAVMGVARVAASGAIGVAAVERTGQQPLTFDTTIPVDLHVSIRVAGTTHSFHADVRVGLVLTARAMQPLRVLIDVRPPRAQDVQVRLEARNWGASVLNVMGSIEHELRRVVAAQVRQRLASPKIQALREFDVGARVDDALAV